MSTKYEIIELQNTQVTIDVSLLKKDQLYFSATEIAKQFGLLPANYLRNETSQRYINAVQSRYAISHNDLVKVKQGGKHQGTWLHNLLIVDFARWCSPEFAVELDAWVVAKLKEEENRKQQIALAKDLHPKLTDAIKGAHENPMFYHYSNEMDMINKIVTGHTAAEYKKLHNVDSVRDNLCIADIELFNECQTRNKIMIEDELDFDTRKQSLMKYVSRQRKLLN